MAKLQSRWLPLVLKKISWSNHPVNTYAWYRNVHIELTLPIHRTLEARRWRRLWRFSSLTHFSEQNTCQRRECTCLRPNHQKRQSFRLGRCSHTPLSVHLYPHPTPAALSIGLAGLEGQVPSPPLLIDPRQKWAWKAHSLCGFGHCPASYHLGLALVRQNFRIGGRKICKTSSFLSHCLQVVNKDAVSLYWFKNKTNNKRTLPFLLSLSNLSVFLNTKWFWWHMI